MCLSRLRTKLARNIATSCSWWLCDGVECIIDSLCFRAFVCRNAYRALLLIYGLVFCGGYIPVMLWIMPDEPFAVGDVYVWGRSWRPVTKLRSELEVGLAWLRPRVLQVMEEQKEAGVAVYNHKHLDLS